MLLVDKHIEFTKKTAQKKDLTYFMTEPTRMNTVYWALNTYRILKKKDVIASKRKEVLEFVMNCKNKDGGFGGNIEYPSNVISTFNALQILYILEEPYTDSTTCTFILNLVQSDGSIMNDRFGETDVRILCSGVLSLHLLERLCLRDFTKEGLESPMSEKVIPYDFKFRIVSYVMLCYNRDGGFGCIPGGETHNAFTFCCLSALRSLAALNSFGGSDIARFIVLRQKENGGLSGRIGKKEDVCYSFWAYASMILIGRKRLINEEKLKKFIFSCQHKEGGFSDRPGNEPDVYHLMFSLAALGLLGHEDLHVVDPGFCL